MIGFMAVGVQLLLAKVWPVGGLLSGGDRTTQGNVRARRWLLVRFSPALCRRWLTRASIPVSSPLKCNHNANRGGDRACTRVFM
jgi:hypothetical protein